MTNTRAHLVRRSLLVSTASLASLVIAAPAAAQDAPADTTAAPAAPAPVALNDTDQIVITGTRRTDRTVTTSASPIDVISAQEIQSQPSANLLDTVKNIVPSFYVPQNTISDASSIVRAPSLRGLPADEVLVQINGKRFNRSALVQVYTGGDTGLGFGSQGSDISAIPSIAIKNLQVLRDGATAQYGSDAIAGVMNFGMRNDRNNLELQARYGQFYDHGHTKLDSGKSRQIAGTAGIGIGATGYFDVAGEWYKDDGTSTGEWRPIAVVFAEQNPSLASLLPNYPGPQQIWGSSPAHGWKGMVNAGVDVTSSSQIYFTGISAYNHVNESFNYRSPIGADLVDVAGVTHEISPNGAFAFPFYLTPCPTGSLTCPAGAFVNDTNTYSFTEIYPAGFTPRFVGVTKERWGTAGWRGELGSGLTWDLSGTLAKNTVTLSMNSSLAPTYGPDTATEFEFGTLSQKERNANLDMTYPVEVGLASPLTLAWGAEYRKEIYGQTEGDPQSYGAGPFAAPQVLYDEISPGVFAPTPYTAGMCAGPDEGDPDPLTCVIPGRAPGASGYGGTSPTYAGSWSQWSWGVYGDAEADITDAFSMGVAGRYEHYNTFGGSFVYKVNGLYKLSPQFSVRGTIGTGFHAPSPGQAHDAILTTNFVAGNQVQTGTYPVDSPISRFYGSTTLKPEKSRNYGAGVVIKPTSTLTATIDGYIINVRGRIGISQTHRVTPQDLIDEPALLAVGEGGDVNFFTNASNTSTKGIDVVGTWRTGLLDGNLTTTLAYNYNKSKVTKFDPDVISAAQRDVVAHLAPNHRATLSANYVHGPWTFNARQNYYSWWRDELDYPGQKFGSEFTTDADLSYDFMRHFRVTVGANNIFNNRPDRIRNATGDNFIYVLTNSTADGQVYPRLGGPFGINGGFWYVRLAAKFAPFEQAMVPLPPPPPPPPPATQACPDGSVVAIGAACPEVAAPPPPPPPPPPPVEKGERG